MLNQKNQKYFLLYFLVVLLLPITTSAQTPAVPVKSIIPAPEQTGDVTYGIAASRNGEVITSVWVGQNTLFVSIATLSGGTWQVQQTISQSGAGALETSVAISDNGNIIVAGDPSQDQVFIYSRESATGMWSLATSITETIGNRFGGAVALNDAGNILAVAAPRADSIAVNSQGAVYIYEQSGGNWLERTIIKPNSSVEFAQDVALSGNGLTLAVGVAPSLVGLAIAENEAVHLFSRAAAAAVGIWGEPDIITASDPHVGDAFGDAVALNTAGNILAVGALSQSDISNGTFGAGAVYIFQRGNEVGSSWQEQQKIKPSGELEDVSFKAEFGTSIDLNGAGDQLVVGAPVASGQNGATYLYGFNEVSDNWGELNIIRGVLFAGLGHQVALNNEYLVTGDVNSMTGLPQLLVVELDSVISEIVTPESLSIAAGGTTTVEVNLEYDPASPVTLTVTSSGEGLTINSMEIAEIVVSSSAVQAITVAAAADTVGGEQILTFSADGYASKQLPVTISSDTLIGSLVLPATAEIREGGGLGSIFVPVTTNPVGNVPALEATVVAEGPNADDLSFPQFTGGNPLLQTLIDNRMEIDIPTPDGIYTGDREILITLSVTGYTDAVMRLTIIDASSDILPTITAVTPQDLSVSRGTSAELEVRINKERSRILRVAVTAGAAITVSPAVLEFEAGQITKTLTVTADALTEDAYEPYSISSVSFDIPGSPQVRVLIDGQFNVVESTDSIFGRSIALSGSEQVMAVGTVSGMGSVDVYTKNDFGYWGFIQTLTANNAEAEDKFGSAIAISDDGSTIAISAPEEDSTKKDIVTGVVMADENDMNDNAGAVYIFTRDADGRWMQQTYIKASNASVGANFGVSLALSNSGDTLAVGADKETDVTVDPSGDPLAAGAVYLFRYEGSWSEANNLKLGAVLIGTASEFGTNVALSGDGMTLAVGSPRSCYDPTGSAATGYTCGNSDDGAVYVFTSSSVDWSESSVQPPVAIRNRGRLTSRGNIGSSVELNRDGTTLVVGVPNDSVDQGSVLGAQRSGAVDIFTKENDLWSFRQQITVPGGENGDRFGADITINSKGTVLAIGVPGDDSGAGGIYPSEDFSFDNNDVENAGAVYLYRLDDVSGMYQHLLSLKPGLVTSAGLEYGTAISLSAGDGGRGSLAVGAAGLFEIIPYSEGTVIVAAPDEFNLDEGSSRTISVNLAQIGDTEVTVNLAVVGEGLEVEPSMLTFSDTAPQNVVVTATDNPDYSDADRTAMVTLTATDYSAETVTVNIIEDDLRLLMPTVEPLGDLMMLSAFATTQIAVTADTEVAVDLLSVETTGSLSLSADRDSPLNSREFSDLAANTPIMIDIFSGTQLGDGEVTLTFSGDGLTTAVRTITASVVPASLIINSVDTLTLSGIGFESLRIEVVGSGIFKEDIDVRFEREEIVRNLLNVTGPGADTLVNLRSGGFAQRSYNLARIANNPPGDTTLRVMVSPPADLSGVIEAETKDIMVSVNLPPIGLTVTPESLEINRTATGIFIASVPGTLAPTLSITNDSSNIVSLIENMIDNQMTEYEVTGRAVGRATLTIQATAFDHNTEMVEVTVNVVDNFNIVVPDTLTLVEGQTMDLNVGLTELSDPAGVEVTIVPTGDLQVSSRSLTFLNTDEQTIVVTAGVDDSVYDGPRTETLMLTATGYPPQTVTVNIMDNDPRPIGLTVTVPPDDLNLVTFEDTEITVSVVVGADLLIETGGAVSLSANGEMSTRQSSLADGATTQIAIYAVGVGDGTVRFSVSGTDLVSSSQTVNVVVSTPRLTFDVERMLNLPTFDTANLSVIVNAEAGNPDGITVEADVEGNAVRVEDLIRTDVQAGTPTVFVVNSNFEADTATIMLTASRDNYVSATEVVTVDVDLRQIGMNITPSPLEIVVGMTEELTIAVGADADIDITVMSADSGRASVMSPDDSSFTLNGATDADSSRTITVTAGNDFEMDTTLTIEASAVGYATQTETVLVDILDLLRLQVVAQNPVPLIEGGNGAITLSVNRIEGVIAVSTEPSREDLERDHRLTISPADISLSNMDPRQITINSMIDGIFTGVPRPVQFMLTAPGYAPVTVNVRITEGDLPPVDFSVNPSPLEVVTGLTAPLTIVNDETLGTVVDITVVSADLTIARVPAADASFPLGGASNDIMRIIEITGVGTAGQRTTLTITASALNHDIVTQMVSVEILEPLSITADPNVFILDEAVNGISSSRQITVTLNRNETGSVDVMVTPDLSTLGLQGIMATNFSGTSQEFTVETINDRVYVGDRNVQFDLTAPDYEPVTVRVKIIEDDPSVIGLSVMPPSLEIVDGTTAGLTVDLTSSVTARITVVSDSTAIASVPDSAADFTLMGGTPNSATTIEVTGVDIGSAQLTIEATVEGGDVTFAPETRLINVAVLDILRITADDIPNLMENTQTDINVNLNRLEGTEVEVMVNIEPPAGTTGLEVSNADGVISDSDLISFTATDMSLTVRAVDNADYDGPRTATLMLTADGYVTETVTVNIMDDERLITLGIDGDTDIRLLRFASAPITVQVSSSDDMLSGVTLDVATEGAVASATDMLDLDGQTSAEIEISGTSVGSGTVTFTAVGPKVISNSVTVDVMVSTPALVISAVSPSPINLETFASADLEVTVNTEAGSRDVMIAAEVITGDMLVAVEQPTRNVRVGTADTQTTFVVDSGADMGTATIMITASHVDYIPATQVVTVNVSERDIGLTVNTQPQPLDIVRGMTGQLTISVTASTDIGITVESDNSDRASVPAAEEAFTLLATEDNRTIDVSSGPDLGDATLTIRASAVGYTTQIETVSVRVLDTLRIEVDGSDEPNSSFNLIEDMSRDIDVNLSRIEEGVAAVTVTLEMVTATTGLEVRNVADTPISELIFSDTAPRMISVIATNNEDYDGPRTATLMLTASGYTTQTVTVNITDDDIGLDVNVDPSDDLSLLRFTSTEITVSVDDGAELLVETEGEVGLSANGATTMTMIIFTDAGMTPVRIHGVGEGQGTVRFTVSGAMKTTEMRVLSVEVTRPALEISSVNVGNLDLLTLTDGLDLLTLVTTTLEVIVNAEAGNPVVTVEADVTNEEGSMVTVMGTAGTDFAMDSGNSSGTATIMITASDSNDNYDVATAEVTVNVDLRTDIGLTVDPLALGIVTRETGELTIEVGADADIGITVTSADSGRASVMTQDSSFTLDGAIATSSSRTVTVTAGNDFEMDTMLTIEASAAGYATVTETVPVDVLDTLRIEVDRSMDLSFDLDEGATRQISVSLSRVEGTEVIVDIDVVPDSITVRDNTNALVDALTFTTARPGPQSIIVEANTVDGYIGNRDATITLMDRNTDYPMTDVVVNIIEDQLPPVGLTVPASLEIVDGMTEQLTIEVDASTDVSITVISDSTAIASVPDSAADFTLPSSESSMTVGITGRIVGDTTLTTLTIEASAAGYATVTETVSVEVLETLRILAVPDSFTLIEAKPRENTVGSTKQIDVILSRIEDTGGVITVNAAVTDGLDAISSFQIGDRRRNILTVGAPPDPEYIRTATLTLTADGYATETVTVTIIENELPPIGLTVTPPVLDSVIGMPLELTIAVSASTDVSIKVTSDDSDIVSVPDPVASFTLARGENSTTIAVNSNIIGDAVLTIQASAAGFATETRTVNVLDRFRIEVDAPPRFDLDEGMDRQIDVNLSLIEGTAPIRVRIDTMGDIMVTDGIAALPVLVFDTTAIQTITVEADGDDVYVGDRPAMITLSAAGYTTKTVMIDIIEDDPQTIGLDVDSADLELVRFEETNIRVSVEFDTGLAALATLVVETEGSVRVLDTDDMPTSIRTYPIIPDVGQTRGTAVVPIYAVNENEGTVKFTVNATGHMEEIVELNVDVTRPELAISAVPVDALDVALFTLDTRALQVTVNAVGGQNVTLTATVDGDDVVTVPPPATGVPVGTPTELTVNSGVDTGTAMITITASHPDYDPASVTFTVTVNLRDIGLSVEPPRLDIVTGTTEQLTISVSETRDISITVASDNQDRARVLADLATTGFILNNASTTIDVGGLDLGDATLTIEASAAGFSTERATVPVAVLDTLFIEVDTQLISDLNEGSTATINVNLSRVEGTTVTVRIETMGDITVTDGANNELTELRFTDTAMQSITVRANNVGIYRGDRSATITLRAANYLPTEVIVDIIEDQLPPVGLTITPSALEPVVGTTEQLTISVSASTDVSITVISDNPARASVPTDLATTGFILNDNSRTIDVMGLALGNATLTIEASAAGFSTESATVPVAVLDTLRIEVDAPDPFVLDEGANSEINVNLSRVEGDAVTVSIATMGDITVTDDAGDELITLMFTDTAIKPITVLANDVDVYRGNRSATVTLTAGGYPDQIVVVDIIEDQLPPVGLTITPSELELVEGMTEELTISVSASTDVSITVMSDSTTIASVPDSAAAFTLTGGTANASTTVEVSGHTFGNAVLLIEVSADGFATETTLINVNVLSEFRIVAEPDDFGLDEETGRQIVNVNLSLIQQGTTPITVSIETMGDIKVTDGTGTTLTELMFNTTAIQSITVVAVDDDDYDGNRPAMITLTAAGYTTETVTVNIEEDELQTVGLNVDSSPVLSLVRFTNTDIEVSVAVGTELRVETGGSVSLSENNDRSMMTYQLTDGATQRVTIYAVEENGGTVRFTVGGGIQMVETVTLDVDVRQPRLEISSVTARNIMLLTSEQTDLGVTVDAEAGNPNPPVTLVASVIRRDEMGIEMEVDTVTVAPEMTPVQVRELTTLTVNANASRGGTAIIRIMASHPDYVSTSTEVPVRVSLRTDIGLMVVDSANRPTTLLDIIVGTDGMLRITATPTTATITVTATAGDNSIIDFGLGTYELDSNNRVVDLSISGRQVGGPVTLRIGLNAEGYATIGQEVEVEVTVVALRTDLGLMVDTTTPLDIIVGETGTLTITAATTAMITVTATAGDSSIINFDGGTFNLNRNDPVELSIEGLRGGTVTLTIRAAADGYEEQEVEVEVTVSLRTDLGLMVDPTTPLDIIVGTTAQLTISVSADTDVSITVRSASSDIASVTDSAFILTGTNSARTIDVMGVALGNATLMIEASAVGYEEQTETVTVNVLPAALRFRIKVFLEGAQ